MDAKETAKLLYECAEKSGEGTAEEFLAELGFDGEAFAQWTYALASAAVESLEGLSKEDAEIKLAATLAGCMETGYRIAERLKPL